MGKNKKRNPKLGIQQIMDRTRRYEQGYRDKVGVDLFSGKGSFKLSQEGLGKSANVETAKGLDAADEAIIVLPQNIFYGGGLPSNHDVERENRVYVTKEELEAQHNPQEDTADSFKRALESKKQELLRYYLTHDFENDLRHEPPKNAEYIAQLLLPKANREALLGDLVEEYPAVVAKFGAGRAKFNFYVHVVFSIFVLVRNAVVKWGLFGWVVEFIRRMGS